MDIFWGTRTSFKKKPPSTSAGKLLQIRRQRSRQKTEITKSIRQKHTRTEDRHSGVLYRIKKCFGNFVAVLKIFLDFGLQMRVGVGRWSKSLFAQLG